MLKLLATAVLCLSFLLANAQDTPVPAPVPGIPYHQIPDFPDTATGPNILARTIDALGYRYYWATEGLRPEDMAYEPGNEGQHMQRLIDHLYGLSETILNTALNQPNMRPMSEQELPWEAKRVQTLLNLKRASDSFKALPPAQLGSRQLIFQRGDREAAFSIWTLINGPLADAMYHTGQVVAFRRSAGNPMHPAVNVFLGRTE